MSTSGGTADPKKLKFRPYWLAISAMVKVSFKASPTAVVMKVIGSFIGAVVPLLTSWFAAQTTTALVDGFGGDAAAGRQAVFYVVATAVTGLLWATWSSVDGYVQRVMAYRVSAFVSDSMFERFLSLEFWRYDDKDTIDLYDRAKRFADSYPRVLTRISSILTAAMGLILAIAALVSVSWWIALILLAAIIPSVYIEFRLSRAQVAHWNSRVDARRRSRMIDENLTRPQHMAEMRLYGVVGHLIGMRRRLREEDEQERLKYDKNHIPKKIVADAIQYVAEVIALIWIIGQIVARAQPVGQFLFVQQIVSRSLSQGQQLVSYLNNMDEDLANIKDYETFMELPVQRDEGIELEHAPSVVEMRDIRFSYSGSDVQVLKGINITIRAGQHVAIVGENGAGKSTLIKILAGLYAPKSGQVLLDGVDRNTINLNSWHKYLAVLSQDFLKYEFATAGENISFGQLNRPRDAVLVHQAADDAEAREFIDKLPLGFENFVSPWMETDLSKGRRRGTGLSGGQWQRLAMARNFYRNAPFMVMDEPTSAIDALAEHRIFSRLFADRSSTIIAISHRLATIEKADVVYMMENGEVVEQGTHQELVDLRGRYFRMFESQL
ncbi:ABC transporter ATP-binding protein [Pseudarthrobacter sp. J1738]|uniref:ABC transporter ATP-binding protein n=1 Tax=Pseudarthrobacter sp. J1738 TaxID=3420446 RepID=UPI003D2A3725